MVRGALPLAGVTMTGLKRVGDVDIMVKDQRRARTFYTEKLGLRVRYEDARFGYLNLGATKGGADAGLSLWQPSPEWPSAMYEDGMKQIGIVTGIGFRTSALPRTLEALRKRRVKVEKDSETFARIWDADGNILFLQQERRPKARRAGLQKLEFVTVASRDTERSGAFFRGLGFKAKKIPGEEGAEGESFSVYQLGREGTSIMPFTPERGMYENAADYDADMAHIGENTGISILVAGIYDLQDRLLSQGIRFQEKAEKQPWGAIAARILDPDDNTYRLVETL